MREDAAIQMTASTCYLSKVNFETVPLYPRLRCEHGNAEMDRKLHARLLGLRGRLERRITAARKAGIERNVIEVRPIGHRTPMAKVGPSSPQNERALHEQC